MSQLQVIASAYQSSWAIADKVRTGNMDANGGAAALAGIRTQLSMDWHELGDMAPDVAAKFAAERDDADRALARLSNILVENDHDRLDFFLSGQLYSSVDPVITHIGAEVSAVRATASQDRLMLRRVNAVAQAMLILAGLAACIAGLAVFRFSNRFIVAPLMALADHLKAANAGNAVAAVPGSERKGRDRRHRPGASPDRPRSRRRPGAWPRASAPPRRRCAGTRSRRQRRSASAPSGSMPSSSGSTASSPVWSTAWPAPRRRARNGPRRSPPPPPSRATARTWWRRA